MKSSAQRMNALLKVREAELETAVSRLLEKRSGLLEGLAKLKTLESEKKKASSEIAENAEGHDPVLHGRFMARLRREALRLTRKSRVFRKPSMSQETGSNQPTTGMLQWTH